jgi:hypothetical protein
MSIHTKKVNLYLLAGVATAPLFMESLRLAMTARLEHAGYAVHAELLFPYGDWSRKLLQQLNEMRRDLWRAHDLPLQSIGGRRAAASISDRRDDGLSILIGHSGGGIAAVHAASILARERAFHHNASIRIIQIGSPKCPIPAWLRPHQMYAYAVNSRKLPSDPITMLGQWGRWTIRRSGMPPTTPASIIRLPLIGGHADYFRGGHPFVNKDGVSNLDTTVQALWLWLCSTME